MNYIGSFITIWILLAWSGTGQDMWAQTIAPTKLAGSAKPENRSEARKSNITRAAESSASKKRKRETEAENIRQIERLVHELAKEHIPHHYVEKKGWGKQSPRWDGVKIQLKRFQLKTKRRTKMVNHGTWKMYSAELLDPRAGFQFKLNSITRNAKGQPVIDMTIIADLKLHGRIAEWYKGVQLIAITAEGNANVSLNLVTTIGTRLDLSRIPPDIHLEPVVDRAQLRVHEFQIRRVGNIGGEVANQVERAVRKILDQKVEKYQQKLVTKLNQSIEKNRSKLKLSVGELVDSRWSRFQKYVLPDKTDK